MPPVEANGNGKAVEAVAETAPVVAPTFAELTGPEVAEIRARNAAADRARDEAQKAQEDAGHKALMAQFAQESLTEAIRRLIVSRGLDSAYQYRVDIETGRIVAARRIQQAPGG